MSDENKNTNSNYLLEDDLEIDNVKNEDDNNDDNSNDDDYSHNSAPEEREDEAISEDTGEEDKNITEEDKSEHEISTLDTDNGSALEGSDDAIVISKSKIDIANAMLRNIKESSEKLIQIFSEFSGDSDLAKISLGQIGEIENQINSEEEGNIIEGVFDGENMIGPDGKQYSVPANYASKSKLVEGDILKLTITGSGTFVYKQIGPIERIRKIGELDRNGDDSFIVRAEDRFWKILPASVTFFKGNVGDEVVLLIPKAGDSKWAAVENIIRNKNEDGNESF